MNVLKKIGFSKTEIKVYHALAKNKGEMTIKEIIKKAKVSEKSARNALKKLLKENFIRRKIVEGKRIFYKYRYVPLKKAWEHFKQNIEILIKSGN